MTYLISIYDHLTGENIVREMTDAELVEYEANQLIQLAKKTEAEAKATAEAEAKATAEGKLAALGLTTDDLHALGLQPVNETLAMCSWYTVKRPD